MATKETGWYPRIESSTIASTNTYVTIRVRVYWQNDGWRYAMGHTTATVTCNGSTVTVFEDGYIDQGTDRYSSQDLGYHDFTIYKSKSTQSISTSATISCANTYVTGTKTSDTVNISVPAKPSYTISYNANGGSGAPGNQTKWYDETMSLQTNTPSRTGYTFVRWNTSSDNTGTAYSPGASYTGNANLTLYAIWQAITYTISYNANGGSGAPGNQTKTYGVNLTLSSTSPTRTNYNFMGWSTSSSGSVQYSPGGTYSANAAATLYAVWSLAYIKPRLNNFSAQRCNSSGSATESGTYAKVTFSWSTDKAVSTIKIEWKAKTASSWTNASVSASGTSGSVSQIVGANALSSETSYDIRAYVSDSGGTTYSSTLTLGTVKFPIDVKSTGNGVAFGKVAEKADTFECAFKGDFSKDITWNSASVGTVNYNDYKKSGIYYMGEKCTNAPAGLNYVRLLVLGNESSGDIIQIGSQVGVVPRTFVRSCVNASWQPWREIALDLYGQRSDNINNFYSTNFVYTSDTTHTPIVYNGYVRTQFCSANYLVQEYIPYNGSGLWRRVKSNGSWQSWIRQPNMPAITAYPSSRQTITGAVWSSTTITLANFSANNSAFAISNGGIKVNAKTYGISKVKVYGTLSYNAYNARGETDIEIYKNSTLVVKKYGACQQTQEITSITSAPVYVDVADGDTFYLKVVKGNATSMVILPENASTSLTVEVIA